MLIVKDFAIIIPIILFLFAFSTIIKPGFAQNTDSTAIITTTTNKEAISTPITSMTDNKQSHLVHVTSTNIPPPSSPPPAPALGPYSSSNNLPLTSYCTTNPNDILCSQISTKNKGDAAAATTTTNTVTSTASNNNGKRCIFSYAGWPCIDASIQSISSPAVCGNTIQIALHIKNPFDPSSIPVKVKVLLEAQGNNNHQLGLNQAYASESTQFTLAQGQSVTKTFDLPLDSYDKVYQYFPVVNPSVRVNVFADGAAPTATGSQYSTTLELTQAFNYQCSNAETTKAKTPLPIIFIPGIAGSELYSGSNIVWPIAPLGSRTDLALNADGTPFFNNTHVIVGDVLRGTAYNFYGGMIDFLKENGYQEKKNLFLFPYDWRMDNANHIPDLDKLVNQARVQSGSEKVILLAHSMGGLIGRAYVQQHPDKVDSLITMGTPWWGAPKVFYGLLNGYDFDNPSVNTKLMKVLAQNWTSAYQLLPRVPFVIDDKTHSTIQPQELYDNIRYHGFHHHGESENYICTTKDALSPSLSFGYLCDEDYALSRWSLNHDLYKASDALYQQAIGTKQNPMPMPAGVKLYTIIGTGFETLSSYVIPNIYLGPNAGSSLLISQDHQNGVRKVIFEPRLADGDGTVTQWSAENDAVTAKYYVPNNYEKGLPPDRLDSLRIAGKLELSSAHADFAENSIVQDLVLSIIQGNPKSPAEYPQVHFVLVHEGIDFTLR